MVKLGDVATFPNAKPDKAHVLKIGEECMEVYSAWENFMDDHGDSNIKEWRKIRLLDECADMIQATCNLIAALGVNDFTFYIDECRERNEERGRL